MTKSDMMEIVIILAIILVPMIFIGFHWLLASKPAKKHPLGGEIKHKTIRLVKGGFATVAESKGEAKSILEKSMHYEGEVGACQYMDGTHIRTVVGICHEAENGGKVVDFIE